MLLVVNSCVVWLLGIVAGVDVADVGDTVADTVLCESNETCDCWYLTDTAFLCIRGTTSFSVL